MDFYVIEIFEMNENPFNLMKINAQDNSMLHSMMRKELLLDAQCEQ